MEGKRLLHSLTLKNVFSFGPEGMSLDFEPLNVLIGPNGSGKSNLIEALGLIHSLPKDLAEPIRQGGGIRNWIRKGDNSEGRFSIDSNWESDGGGVLNYALAIGSERNKPLVLGEWLGEPLAGTDGVQEMFYLYSENGHFVGEFPSGKVQGTNSPIANGFRRDQSIFAQRRDTDEHPKEAYLGDLFSEIRLYRDWTFGRSAAARRPRPVNDNDHYLEEDPSNLGLVLKRLLTDSETQDKLNAALKILDSDVEGIRIIEISEFISFSLDEGGGRLIPSTRLSDGMLRYLSLTAVLCDPKPGPLICVEEPELGLHPDIIPTIARLLIDASQRTQLIVTTHPADLISALGEFPESVVVCNRGFQGTEMVHLEPDRLKKWLEDYSLGQLWGMGEIGGNRW